jgi:acyl carrier protein
MNRTDLIIKIFSEYHQGTVDLNTKIEDMEIDSIDLLEIALKLEDNFNVEIDLAEISYITTLGELVESLGEVN